MFMPSNETDIQITCLSEERRWRWGKGGGGGEGGFQLLSTALGSLRGWVHKVGGSLYGSVRGKGLVTADHAGWEIVDGVLVCYKGRGRGDGGWGGGWVEILAGFYWGREE